MRLFIKKVVGVGVSIYKVSYLNFKAYIDTLLEWIIIISDNILTILLSTLTFKILLCTVSKMSCYSRLNSEKYDFYY